MITIKNCNNRVGYSDCYGNGDDVHDDDADDDDNDVDDDDYKE